MDSPLSPTTILVSLDMLTPCRSKPNCVSSLNHEKRFRVKPLSYSSLETAKNVILDILGSGKRTRIVTNQGQYIRAESRSCVFRFIDDIEFYFDDDQKLIHIKSASRIGFYDLGANRRRVRGIRKKYLKGG